MSVLRAWSEAEEADAVTSLQRAPKPSSRRVNASPLCRGDSNLRLYGGVWAFSSDLRHFSTSEGGNFSP